MLADIAHGEVNAADIMFLIAVILFVVAVVIRVMARTFDSAIVAAGLAFVALGWLLL